MKLDIKTFIISFIGIVFCSLEIEHCLSLIFNTNALLLRAFENELYITAKLQLALIISPVLVIVGFGQVIYDRCYRENYLMFCLLLVVFSFSSFLIVSNNGLGDENLIDPVFLSDVSFDEKKSHYMNNLELLKENAIKANEKRKIERLISEEEKLKERIGKSIQDLNLEIENINTIIIEKEQLKYNQPETTKSL